MKKALLTKYLVSLVIALGFFTTLLYARAQIANNQSSIPSPTPTLFPTPTLESTPTLKAKDAITTKTQPVANSDPIIDCESSHPSCNGETIRLKSSQCSKIYCCGLSDGRWILYSSKEKCEAEAGKIIQQAPQQVINTQANKIPVYISYYGSTRNCPSNNVVAIQAIDADLMKKKDEVWKQYGICDKNKKANDPCWIACTSQSNLDYQPCFSYSYPAPEYTSCMDAAGARYRDCISKCTLEYDECKLLLYPINSLTSQIDNLCK